jgi:ATP-binding cassette subfamily B protein
LRDKIFIRILRFILPYKKQLIIGSLLAFAFSIANGITLYSIVPMFNTLSPGTEKYQMTVTDEETRILRTGTTRNLMDRILYLKSRVKQDLNRFISATDKFTLLIYICIALFFIFLIRIVLELLVVYYIGYAGNGGIRDIRQSIYQSMLFLPLSFFYKHKTGDLISRIIYNTDLISGSLSNQLRKFIVNIFIVITHVALLLYINAELTLIALMMLLAITIPILLMGRSFKRYTKIEQESMSDISSIVIETVNGIRIIKSYQMEDLQIRRFFKSAKRIFIKMFRKALIDFSRPHVVEIIASLFAVFLFISGGKMVISGVQTKGEFLFFVLTFLFIMNPIKQIANMNNQIKQSEAAGESIFPIIDEKGEALEAGAPDAVQISRTTPDRGIISPEREISYKNVSFRYPGTDSLVLRDISFSVNAGERIAIVGRSGVGKTTLVDLLPRFYDVSGGSIFIDNTEIRTIPLRELRNSIGIVTQEVFLFNGTISENIAYGLNDSSFDAIRESAVLANAHDFIMKIPDGYDSTIGEKGILLSGGERQRIAIARSILRNPSILIFDEATSSLDAESEKLVQSALNMLMKRRTTFIIAHRLSTVISADRIIVLEKGTIVETGTHGELLQRDGLYKMLYEIQFAENDESGE